MTANVDPSQKNHERHRLHRFRRVAATCALPQTSATPADCSSLAAMQTAAAVIDALERAPDLIVPLVREVPQSLIKRRPAPGKWSAHEHACHLAVVHRLFFDRLDVMLSSPAPVFKGYQPGRDEPDDALLQMDLDRSLDQYVDGRHALVARLRTLSPEVWARTAEHAEYSHYSVFIMFRHVALHDFFHAYRIEELLLKKEWG